MVQRREGSRKELFLQVSLVSHQRVLILTGNLKIFQNGKSNMFSMFKMHFRGVM